MAGKQYQLAMSIFLKLKLRFFNQSLLGQSLLVLALLLGQQGSALHSLRHAFAEQTQNQKKHAPVGECEQCISYAQFFGSLSSARLTFDFSSTFTEAFVSPDFPFHSSLILPAIARGPPAFQRSV